jgi:MFS transporter, BCD family, chlorophyll transporter
MAQGNFGWFAIVRLGLVQTALGSIVVLTTATMNRVMVVELALPALVPGALVALHHLLQMCRPRFGHGSDVGGRSTPWILGGLAALAAGAIGASAAIAWMPSHFASAIVLAVMSFTAIGLGVGSAGTSLLVLLAKRVDDRRRGAAATIVWMMMIAGFVVTTTVGGHYLDPYSPGRLMAVTAIVSALALAVAIVALWGVEGRAPGTPAAAAMEPAAPRSRASFVEALKQVWSEPQARRFTWFVFVSMLAYSAQDLILEPFAGTVFGYTPGATTRLSGVLHGGVLCGMAIVAVVSAVPALRRFGDLRTWMIGGCLVSGAVLCLIASGTFAGPAWPLRPVVFALGTANGAFAVSAIGTMMQLAGHGRSAREGVRMGLWGAAQAIAFGCAGLLATGASDLARHFLSSPAAAYCAVFCLEALLFLWAAGLAADAVRAGSRPPASAPDLRVLRVDLDEGRAT